MTAAPAPAVIDRLGKALALLGSPHDGEALAAARAAHRILRSAGLGWSDILVARLPSPESERADSRTNYTAGASLARSRAASLLWKCIWERMLMALTP